MIDGLKEYEDTDFCIHMKVDEKAYLTSEPFVESITKQDIIDIYKNILSYKPKQFPTGLYVKVFCSDCDFTGIIHKDQQFCPSCYRMDLGQDEEDVNFKFDELFEKWQKMKLYVETILNGDVIKFLNEFNSNIETDKSIMNAPEITESYMGIETMVDE